LAAVPVAAAAGLSDWSDLQGETQRVGLVHAAANVTASSLYLLSLRARRRGRRGTGAALGLLGLAAVGLGGFLGGHLSYRRGIGVDHTFDRTGPEEWTDVASEDEVADAVPFARRVGDDDVLLLRRGDRIDAVSDRCTHLSGPLHEGQLDGACITCPWHQSTFRLDDGSVVHGPATAPQPRYEVRRDDGRILVRRAER
jgi:nitrite reductase/ring-hydroxylating ferredoxin subunit